MTANCQLPTDDCQLPTAISPIAIVGLGYVGLPLGLQFARSGVPVLGVDIDPAKVVDLNAGRSYIRHIPAADIQAQRESGRLEATTDFSRLREVSAILICVPTPLTKNREPDLSYVLNTARSIAPYLAGSRITGASLQTPETPSPSSGVRPLASDLRPLVVLESTTYPGTTEGELRRELEAGSGLVAGRDFHLAFSPEREDPGRPDHPVADIPKLVGGLTPPCCDRAAALYRRAIRTVVPVSSCRTAEAAKLLENVFRGVNIALVNELKLAYGAMGIDIWEVIAAAKTKPFGFMPFYPGPGLGGHCIPIDPFYLSWKARAVGQPARFIELAGEINTAMPQHVVRAVTAALAAQKKSVSGARLLILGLAYKADVDDDRESPAYRLLDLLAESGAAMAYHDPHIPVIRPTREHPHWAGRESVAWTRENLSGFDAVVIVTAHGSVNYQELADWCPCLVDTRNVMSGFQTRPGQVWKA
ncbi:MAG: nucleotide sugar dehydrogenase [Verrucomicrobiota bacterium]